MTLLPEQETRPGYAQLCASAGVGPCAEKQLFGGKFVRRERLFAVGWEFFQAGALLALAFHDRLDAFACPFTGMSLEDSFILLEDAEKSVARVEAAADGTLDLFYMHEMRLSSPKRSTSEWPTWREEEKRGKIPLGTALRSGFMYGVLGAGFAAQWPDRWRQLDRAYFELVDNRNEGASFDARQKEVVSGFAAFCRDFWPECLRPLGFID